MTTIMNGLECTGIRHSSSLLSFKIMTDDCPGVGWVSASGNR